MKRFATPIMLIATALAALGSATAQVAPQQGSRAAGVVLLTSGEVLRGSVTDEGEQALVTLGPGSQMRLPHGQIVCTGQTLDDVFVFQHRRLQSGDVPGRIELARWCLRSDLPSAAGRVMVELVELAPDDARVLALEQQLRQRVRKPPERATPDEPVLVPPAEELKGVAQQVSPPAFDTYMRQIQPLLMNRCAASGCHGVASKSSFQLLRPLTGVKLTQRMTQRNLHAVLAQVDDQAPLDSPLLAAATQPHATFAEPLVDEKTDRAEIEALKNWLRAVAKKPALDDSPATTLAPARVLLQPQSGRATEPPQIEPAPRAASRPPRSPAEHAERPSRAAEEFNRRYFPERFDASDRR